MSASKVIIKARTRVSLETPIIASYEQQHRVPYSRQVPRALWGVTVGNPSPGYCALPFLWQLARDMLCPVQSHGHVWPTGAGKVPNLSVPRLKYLMWTNCSDWIVGLPSCAQPRLPAGFPALGRATSESWLLHCSVKNWPWIYCPFLGRGWTLLNPTSSLDVTRHTWPAAWCGSAVMHVGFSSHPAEPNTGLSTKTIPSTRAFHKIQRPCWTREWCFLPVMGRDHFLSGNITAPSLHSC